MVSRRSENRKATEKRRGYFRKSADLQSLRAGCASLHFFFLGGHHEAGSTRLRVKFAAVRRASRVGISFQTSVWLAAGLGVSQNNRKTSLAAFAAPFMPANKKHRSQPITLPEFWRFGDDFTE